VGGCGCGCGRGCEVLLVGVDKVDTDGDKGRCVELWGAGGLERTEGGEFGSRG